MEFEEKAGIQIQKLDILKTIGGHQNQNSIGRPRSRDRSREELFFLRSSQVLVQFMSTSRQKDMC